MNYTEIIDNVQDVISNLSKDSFVYDPLDAHGTPKATITRLKSGSLNRAREEGEAHHLLDLAVDCIYRSKPFDSDEERLEHLFKLYEEMVGKEKTR